MAPGAAFELVARALRRTHRRHSGRCGDRGHRLRHGALEDRAPRPDRPCHGRADRVRRDEDRLLGHPSLRREARRPRRLPMGPDLHVVPRRARPWDQRCAEDDGSDHPRDDHDRLAVRRPSRARAVGHRRVCLHHRPRHLPRRMAHHPHPRQGADRRQARPGLRCGELDRGHHPRLQRPRLRPLHHAGRVRFGDRLRPRPPRVHRALADRRPHRSRLAADASRCRRRRRSRGAAGGLAGQLGSGDRCRDRPGDHPRPLHAFASQRRHPGERDE